MEENRTRREETLSIQDPEELGRVADAFKEMLDNEMAAEAVVRFSRLRPPDQADVMAQLSRDSQAKLLSQLTPKSLSTIIEELEPEEAVELSQGMEPEQL